MPKAAKKSGPKKKGSYNKYKKNTGPEVQGTEVAYQSAPGHKKNGAHLVLFPGLHATTSNQKIAIIKKGVSKNELTEIKKESDLDYDTLSNILSVSRATLINKKPSEKFDQPTSERIVMLADVIAYGQSVFENKAHFSEWIKKPSKALGNKTPIELMDTIYGIDEVKKELARIEFGIF